MLLSTIMIIGIRVELVSHEELPWGEMSGCA